MMFRDLFFQYGFEKYNMDAPLSGKSRVQLFNIAIWYCHQSIKTSNVIFLTEVNLRLEIPQGDSTFCPPAQATG